MAIMVGTILLCGISAVEPTPLITQIVTGTFSIAPERTFVIEKPPIAPNVLPIPTDLINEQVVGEFAIAMAAAVASPFVIFLIGIVVVQLAAYKVRRRHNITLERGWWRQIFATEKRSHKTTVSAAEELPPRIVPPRRASPVRYTRTETWTPPRFEWTPPRIEERPQRQMLMLAHY